MSTRSTKSTSSTKSTKRRPKPRLCAPEDAIQAAIVEYLEIRGYLYKQTNLAKRRPTCDKGVPDLIVTHPTWPRWCLLGMEVKAADGKPTKEQKGLIDLDRIVVVRSVLDASVAVNEFIRTLDSWRKPGDRLVTEWRPGIKL